MENSELRRMARAQLRNNLFSSQWLYALLVCFLGGAIIGAVTATGIGALIVSGPIALGTELVFVSLARGKSDIELGDMFKGFTERFSQSLVIFILTAIFTFLWSLLFVIPGIVKSYSYAMAYYISIDNPSMGANECITASRKLMDGKKWKLFCLDFSFIGWYIVGALCFGIGTLWVIPYHEAARANFYCSLVSEPNV